MFCPRENLECNSVSKLIYSGRTKVRFSVPRTCSQQLDTILKSAKSYTKRSNSRNRAAGRSKSPSTNYSGRAESSYSISSRKLLEEVKMSANMNSPDEVSNISIDTDCLCKEIECTAKDNDQLNKNIQRIEDEEWKLAKLKQTNEMHQKQKESIEDYKKLSEENKAYQSKNKLIEKLITRKNKDIAWKEHQYVKSLFSKAEKQQTKDILRRETKKSEIQETVKVETYHRTKLEKERRSSSYNEFIANNRQNQIEKKWKEKQEELKHKKAVALGSLIETKRRNLELRSKMKIIKNLTNN